MKDWEEKEISLHHSYPHLRFHFCSTSSFSPRLASRSPSCSAYRSPSRFTSGSRYSTPSAAGNSPLVTSFLPASSLPVSFSPHALSANISSANYILLMTDHSSENNEPPKKKKCIYRREALIKTIEQKEKSLIVSTQTIKHITSQYLLSSGVK
ncbi:hypothetical protein [Parasitella parasitica]|uniref:Uncharacterized protein n=1 Tax=Parasitella parasitica TaxID=35722 RepID=A0A0B7NK10_9FUNG|nr:hypothetical protein [Parasitella parasitica]